MYIYISMYMYTRTHEDIYAITPVTGPQELQI